MISENTLNHFLSVPIFDDTFRRRAVCQNGDVAMCSTLERFLGQCGYMQPTTKFAIVSMIAAAFLAMALAARS
jgi:hypothetical protein